MIDQILRRTKEMKSYIEHVCNQLAKDQKTGSHVSMGELNMSRYGQALDHLHKALELIDQQTQITTQYQKDEEEKEQIETPNKISARIF